MIEATHTFSIHGKSQLFEFCQPYSEDQQQRIIRETSIWCLSELVLTVQESILVLPQAFGGADTVTKERSTQRSTAAISRGPEESNEEQRINCLEQIGVQSAEHRFCGLRLPSPVFLSFSQLPTLPPPLPTLPCVHPAALSSRSSLPAHCLHVTLSMSWRTRTATQNTAVEAKEGIGGRMVFRGWVTRYLPWGM
ncbi:hypothetical protein LEMLEM_LOCUS16974 [Lemmus lemmus]